MKVFLYVNRILIVVSVSFLIGGHPVTAQSKRDTSNHNTLRTRWTEHRIQYAIDFITNGRHQQDMFKFKDTTDDDSMYDFRYVEINDTLRPNPAVDLSYSHFEGARIRYLFCKKGTNLEGVKFTYDTIRTAILEGVNLSNADLEYCFIGKADMKRADLDSANLEHASLISANLDSASFFDADLESIRLDSSSLKQVNFSNANLRFAICTNAGFQNSCLSGAQLIGTQFWEADLQSANVEGANLLDAYLSDANVRDADFFEARFDSTMLSFTNLGEAKIKYIVWGDSLHKRYYIGDENFYGADPADNRRGLYAQIIEDTYHNLEGSYKIEGRLATADAFHYRQNDVLTKSYPVLHPLRILRTVFLQWPYGYGSRPIYLFYWSFAVVFLFTFIFTLFTSTRSKSGIYIVTTDDNGIKNESLLNYRNGLLFFDCFYFSLLSFSTFGYGAIQPKQWLEFFRTKPVEFKPVGSVRIFVGIVATLGIYTFALFVTAILKGG